MIVARGKFIIEVYSITVHIIVCENSEDVILQANKYLKRYREKLISGNADGVLFTPDQDPTINYLFLSAEGLNVNIITHETDHLRTSILDFCSVREQDDAREASAYLNGYINEKVFRFLERKKIKINY